MYTNPLQIIYYVDFIRAFIYRSSESHYTAIHVYMYPEDMFYCLVNALYNYFYANFGVLLKECLSYSHFIKDKAMNEIARKQ